LSHGQACNMKEGENKAGVHIVIITIIIIIIISLFTTGK